MTSNLIVLAILSLLILFLGDSHGVEFDLNVPAEIRTQIENDLEFLSQIQGDSQSPLHLEIFGKLSGATYAEFFTSRIRQLGLSDCQNEEAMACVNPLKDSAKMWITPNYILFNHPLISRIMTVIHESRHTEKKNRYWAHSHCPIPFVNKDKKPILSIWTGFELAGKNACDHTAFGSYGASIILLKNIAKYCTNCTEKVKLDATIYADDQLTRITLPRARKQIQDDSYPEENSHL